MPEQKDFAQARSLAFRYLSYRDRSQSEMVKYLAKKDVSENIAQEVILYLNDRNYINDERFALNWGKSRIENKQLGKHRLQQELREKGLHQETIAKALQELYSDVDEFQLAQSCVEKKIRSYENLDANTKNRRMAQFLQRKGFPSHIIFKILNS